MKAEVMKTFNMMTDLYASGEYGKIADLYTEDTKVLTTQMGMMEGRQSVSDYYQAAKEKAGIHAMTMTSVEVEEHGDVVTVFGDYELFAEDGTSLGKGKGFDVMKMVDGQLKIYWDATI